MSKPGAVLENADDWWHAASGVLQAKIVRRVSTASGVSLESADAVLDRVSETLASMESRHYSASRNTVQHWAQTFRALMRENKFWPSGRILNNCGTNHRELASCFVLPLADEFEQIFDTLQVAARCHRSGGGTGFDFTPIRERGARISTSDAAGSSGPVSWLQLFNAETHVVMQGGKMRGANLASISVRHPDVIEFIEAKSQVGRLANFNLSIAVDDEFMRALATGASIELRSPTGPVVRSIAASEIWNRIVECAWRTGDPGLLFVDTINRRNPLLSTLGPIRTTNPCGEQTLYPYEPSNLGSLNLSSFTDSDGFDWAGFTEAIQHTTRLLDNAIDASEFADARIRKMSQTNRRLGLGVMGFADALCALGIQYDSDEALLFIDRLGTVLRDTAWATSAELAAERGPFPNFVLTGWQRPVRNCAITTLAPTGTISMIAGCSSGIEPKFAPRWRKNVLSADGFVETDRMLVADLRRHCGVGDYEARALIDATVVQRLPLPPQVRNRYRYAHDISGAWHVKVAARWQRYIDNAVSKTVNLAPGCSPADTAEVMRLSWELGCKGISVYRAGSREQDLLEALDDEPLLPVPPQSVALLAADGAS